jgi:hypothetical protein
MSLLVSDPSHHTALLQGDFTDPTKPLTLAITGGTGLYTGGTGVARVITLEDNDEGIKFGYNIKLFALPDIDVPAPLIWKP